MHLLSILFFCIASSSDSFIIGLTYGSKAIKISFWSNLLVAAIACIGTFGSMLLGKGVFFFMSEKQTGILGGTLLILFGVYMLISSTRVKKDREKEMTTGHYHDYIEHPEKLDKDNSKEIELGEAVALGFILCLNNIGLGIGASIAGLNMYITSILALIFSMVFVKSGFYIGNKILSGRLSRFSEYISAIIIIVLGLSEFFR